METTFNGPPEDRDDLHGILERIEKESYNFYRELYKLVVLHVNHLQPTEITDKSFVELFELLQKGLADRHTLSNAKSVAIKLTCDIIKRYATYGHGNPNISKLEALYSDRCNIPHQLQRDVAFLLMLIDFFICIGRIKSYAVMHHVTKCYLHNTSVDELTPFEFVRCLCHENIIGINNLSTLRQIAESLGHQDIVDTFQEQYHSGQGIKLENAFLKGNSFDLSFFVYKAEINDEVLEVCEYFKKRTKRKRFVKALLVTTVFLSIFVILLILAASFTIYFMTTKEEFDIPGVYDGWYPIGSNTTVLIGDCVSSEYITGVTLDMENPVPPRDIYLTTADVMTREMFLPTKFLGSYKGADNFSINYYDTNPIYTASKKSTLTYYLEVNNSLGLDCPVTFYLYDLHSLYDGFDPFVPPSDLTIPISSSIANHTICNQSTKFEESFNFTLPRSGFYLVHGSLKEGVSINVSVSANLYSYDVSSFIRECQLNQSKSSCHFDMSITNEDMCIFVSSTVIPLHNITISYDVDFIFDLWYINFVYSVMFPIDSFLLLVTLVLFVTCLLCCVKISCTKRKRYIRLDVTPLSL